MLDLLAERLGLSKTGVVEMAIRKLAQGELAGACREGDDPVTDSSRPSTEAISAPGQP